VKRWYDGNPTFETRRDSTLTVIERPTGGQSNRMDGVR